MAESFYVDNHYFGCSAGADSSCCSVETSKGVSTMKSIFPHGKKGMEMWQLVIIILALLLLLAVLAWYSGLNKELGALLDNFNNFT